MQKRKRLREIFRQVSCTSRLWLAISLTQSRERVFIFFGRHVTHKVGNQKTLYYVTSDKLCFCITWQNGETQKLHFSLKCIARVQPVTTWFLQPFRLTTHKNAAVWLPKSCNQCVRLWTVGGMVHDKRSRERCRSWTMLHAQTAQCTRPVRCLLGFLFRKVMLKH